MAAAVADYRPKPVTGKRAKTGKAWGLSLRPTEDVLAGFGESKNGTVLVGFGAEEGEAGLERKRRMLTEKNLDLVVFNDVSRADIGFDSPENEVILVSATGERTLPKAPKERIAAEILDEVERLLGGGSLNPPASSRAAIRASSGGWVSKSELNVRPTPTAWFCGFSM
jgi:phosphopantothenoylcysteine decarboxylase/phosphopantothenate--cysteine ligase